MQIISRHPHLFAGETNELNLFFALRIVKQKHRRDRKSFLASKRRTVGGVSMTFKKSVRQPKKVIDLVSK